MGDGYGALVVRIAARTKPPSERLRRPPSPEMGEGNAVHPPIASTSRAANLLFPLTFPNLQRHQPSWLEPVPDSCPSRRWGGRRIQRLDVGGLWSSDEARRMETSGVLADVDG